MWFEYRGDSIAMYLDENEETPTPEAIVEAMVNSIDITFGELLNEGFPVCLGNSYAEYLVTCYVYGVEYEYGVGQMECDALANMRATLLTTYGTYTGEDRAC